ncbi:hypothetical protein OS493_018761 [Desmophyllum pertusum]|uniref:Uncharacterized protein n=1 Tax=Desmophyllum pertusum TaxID=174260 RepID=A0A9W9ZNX0_9CNID|nr:hypothetical protein OS493_018761 [Desmophyllum pertusum]
MKRKTGGKMRNKYEKFYENFAVAEDEDPLRDLTNNVHIKALENKHQKKGSHSCKNNNLKSYGAISENVVTITAEAKQHIIYT